MLIGGEIVHGAGALLPGNITCWYPYSEHYGYQKRARRSAGEIL